MTKVQEKKVAEKIKESKCTCNQCKHVWHYLDSEVNNLKLQALGNSMIGCGMCCNPFGALFLNKSNQLSRDINKFTKCPKCGSGDITQETHYYDKKN